MNGVSLTKKGTQFHFVININPSSYFISNFKFVTNPCHFQITVRELQPPLLLSPSLPSMFPYFSYYFHFQISYEPFGCCHLVSFDLYSYYLVSLFAFSAVNCSLSANYPCRNIVISSDSEVEDGDMFADNALRYVHHLLTQLISVLILSTLDSIV